MATDRATRWAGTMPGHRVEVAAVRQAHAGDDLVRLELGSPLGRQAREDLEEAELAPGATRSAPATGRRRREEEPDELRTCFEQDRDRVLHSPAFRRLAGKTQVFIFPADHQRTRLTHALEVAQVATAIARACRLNVALTEAIALGHDCGHGPGGHASEDAFSVFVPEFDHAVWGADVTAAPLNLCRETLDGIRNHSWSRPAPSTPEGQVVGLAD
ncbi:MAG TPA: HD domain-containing protein, partial [Acidimicrobiales bacterium]|nr:HD domain-containing protein [Acidimicrobiales bacterium]